MMAAEDAQPFGPVAPHLGYYAEVCRRNGWRFAPLDRHSGHLAEITDGRRGFVVAGGRACIYPINAASAIDVARDKAHSLSLLRHRGSIATPRGACFFLREAHRDLRGPGRELADAAAYAQGLGYPVCVKPNDGARGHLVEFVYDDRGLADHLERVAVSSHAALLQEAVDHPEYRMFVLDGRVRFAYRRLRPMLTGDGKRTVNELLADMNARLARRDLSLIARDSQFLLHNLKEAGLAPSDVPRAGQAICPAPRANLSAGGVMAEFRDTLSPATEAWAARVAQCTGLRVLAIDLFAQYGLERPEGFLVMEVNGNPSLNGLVKSGREEVAYTILADVCHAWFAG